MTNRHAGDGASLRRNIVHTKNVTMRYWRHAPLIAIGKRDGMLMLLDADGSLQHHTVMPGDIRALAALGQGGSARLAVATAQGIHVLDAELAAQSSFAMPNCGAVAWLADKQRLAVVGMTDHGNVAAYSVE